MADELRDEVSFSDYRRACAQLVVCATALEQCSPDEAAEHWLPQLTLHIAIIFSFVGVNMTARHVPRYVRTVAALDAAKDVTSRGDSGRVHTQPNTGGT